MVDVVVSLGALIVLSPLLLIIAVAVKLSSPGPVLYRQLRLMRDGRPFILFKFRTMFNGADQMLDQVSHLNGASWPLFKARRDPRVTPVGKLLRRMFMDELPQLFNVVRGEMSLVGPRPCLSEEAENMPELFEFRFSVPQGVTGPWQINGHHALTLEEQLRVEREYIESWSFWKDLVILVRTAPLILRRSGF
jgi:lipopolysaccharide/colanic/teichoic acid biosynthesis glycosyltransferase